MNDKTTAFYRDNKEISVDFSVEGVSSDGAAVLLEKVDRQHQLIKRFSKVIPDGRDPSKVDHSVEKMLRQRVFMLTGGYEDCNDAQQLTNAPVLTDTLGGGDWHPNRPFPALKIALANTRSSTYVMSGPSVMWTRWRDTTR